MDGQIASASIAANGQYVINSHNSLKNNNYHEQS